MNIMVSIETTAFNHAPYIAQTLDGFLMQKTDFPFEVVIHDDASTDGTADIIRQYAEKYPDIIRPIFQTENQYSKGVDIYTAFLDPACRGKYLAICEGDDYWCDEHKLQKQVDFMEAHPDYSACVHNTMLVNTKTGEQYPMYSTEEDYDISFSKVIERGSGAYHTSSLFLRTELETQLAVDCPPYFTVSDFGDYPLAIYLRCCGKIHFLKDTMSVYRQYTAGSWSASNRDDLSSHNEQQRLSQIQVLESVDEYTKGIHHEDIVYAINRHYFYILTHYINNHDFSLPVYTRYFLKLNAQNKKELVAHVCGRFKQAILKRLKK